MATATATAKKTAKKTVAKRAPAKLARTVPAEEHKPAEQKAPAKGAESNGHARSLKDLHDALTDPVTRGMFIDHATVMDITHRLVAERNRIEMGQGDLSRLINVPQPTISLMESGKQPANLFVLLKYARAVGLRLELNLTR